MTSKEIQIMVTAMMKSLIETGTPIEQLEDKTMTCCRILLGCSGKIEAAMTRPRPEPVPGGNMLRKF
jgi:hypothetical protein